MWLLQAFKETAYHFHVLIKTPVLFVSFVPSLISVKYSYIVHNIMPIAGHASL